MMDRKGPRFKTRIRIFFSGGAIEGEGTVVDLSKGGCRVECETELAIGDEVEAWVYPPDHEWPLKIERAIVRWRKATEFGLEFLQIQPAQKERLRLVLNGKNLGPRT